MIVITCLIRRLSNERRRNLMAKPMYNESICCFYYFCMKLIANVNFLTPLSFNLFNNVHGLTEPGYNFMYE